MSLILETQLMSKQQIHFKWVVTTIRNLLDIFPNSEMKILKVMRIYLSGNKSTHNKQLSLASGCNCPTLIAGSHQHPCEAVISCVSV